MRGAPLKTVQELMGHSTIEMTMRYAHLSPDAKREAVELLDVREEVRLCWVNAAGAVLRWDRASELVPRLRAANDDDLLRVA